MLEFGETPDDWPEDIAICEKVQILETYIPSLGIYHIKVHFFNCKKDLKNLVLWF